jgi:RNA polymerase sigma-70 factor (ECF subfamily)
VAATDATLILGARNGDRSAFAELYDRRARLIRALCYDETRDLHAAADLTQEVFLRAYKNLRRLHRPDRFAAWLVGIARQQAGLAGLAQQRGSGPHWAEPPDERLIEIRDAIAGLTACEAKALPSLTEHERLALHAFYLQGRSAQEARSALGLSKSGFYRALSSAVERLRRILSKQEVCP